jgi:hypothetical protein
MKNVAAQRAPAPGAEGVEASAQGDLGFAQGGDPPLPRGARGSPWSACQQQSLANGASSLAMARGLWQLARRLSPWRAASGSWRAVSGDGRAVSWGSSAGACEPMDLSCQDEITPRSGPQALAGGGHLG